MQEGSSQGLFIVLAIIIFGLFVTLSYSVFGRDGLSGSTEHLFNQSIGYVNDKLPYTVQEEIHARNFRPVFDNLWYQVGAESRAGVYVGRRGTENSEGVYVFDRFETFDGIEYESRGISSLYVQTLEENPLDDDIVDASVTLNGVKIEGTFTKRLQNGYIRYFYSMTEKPYTEVGQVYTVSYIFTTESGKEVAIHRDISWE